MASTETDAQKDIITTMKGTSVTSTEHHVKPPRTTTGLIATLRGVLRVRLSAGEQSIVPRRIPPRKALK